MPRRNRNKNKRLPSAVAQDQQTYSPPDQKTGPLGNMMKSPASPPKEKGSHTSPVCSASGPSSSKGRDSSDLLPTSPNRVSGRARKKTEKGAVFDESLKPRKKNLEEDSDVDTSITADPSDQAAAEPSSEVPLNEPKPPPRKRGRPRKSETLTQPKEIAKNSHDTLSTTQPKEIAKNSHDTLSHDTLSTTQPKEIAKNSHDTLSTTQPKEIAKNSHDTLSTTQPKETAKNSHDTLSTDSPQTSDTGGPDTQAPQSQNSSKTQSTEDSAICVEAVAESKPERKKRGRPRKSDPVSRNTQPTESAKDSNDTQTEGPPQKSDTVGDDTQPTESNVTQSAADMSISVEAAVEPKPEGKKRGRPRKSEVVSHDAQPNEAQTTADTTGVGAAAESKPEDGEAGQTTPKRKRGRPKKQKPSEDSIPQTRDQEKTEDAEQMEEEQGRGQRRRSKKITYNEEEEEEEEEEERDEEAAPRDRRRKTSSRKQEEEELEEEGGATERSRRRSKNTTVHFEEEEEDEDWEEKEEAVVPKKTAGRRGRKPKSKETTPTAKVSVASPPIEACLRCQKKMDSLEDYKKHLIDRHAALYSKECPEGDESHNAIQQILKKFKHVTCPKCRKTFKSAQYFRHHLKWCGRENIREVCKVCGKSVQAMWMQQHEREHRKKEAVVEDLRKLGDLELNSVEGTKRKAAAASLLKMKAAAMDNMEPMDGSLKKRNRKTKRDDDWKDQDDEDRVDDDDDVDDDGDDNEESGSAFERLPVRMDGRRLINRAPDFFQKHHNLLDKLPKGSVFPSLLPQRAEWTPLSESESAKYQPETRESVPVIFKRSKTNPTEPATVQWGDAICDNKQGTAFVGGCVWSLEWCPVDQEVDSGCDQVLAVSASREMWSDWMMFTRGEGPGLVQFWTAGNLMVSGRQECGPSLKLVFSVAHDFLHSLSMSWCPRRAYLESDTYTTLPRLGLLALAGYHGDVAVYSVPTPESLKGHGGAEGGRSDGAPHPPPTFKPPPSLTLLSNSPEMTGPCLSVAWQKGDNCDFIAGGYAKGFVHLWRLNSSPLSVRATGPKSRAAVRMFYAHYGVTSVDWSWLQAMQFVTGSVENQIKVWDVKDTRTPLMVHPDSLHYEKGPTRAVAFGSSVVDTVFFADDQRDVLSGAVYGIDLTSGYLLGPTHVKKANYTLAKHAACVWSIGYSPWYNMMVSGDSTGLMYLSSCTPIMLSGLKGYTKKHKGLPVFSTTLMQKTEDQDVKHSDGKDFPSTEVVPSAEGLHIIFTDQNMEEKKDFIHTGNEEAICRSSFDSFNAADIYATAFNLNKAHSQWLACGTRAGFVRILRLPCVTQQCQTAQAFFAHKTTSKS